jgi:dipeptidyl aminopeptidase/acylaminoacyl peptidase
MKRIIIFFTLLPLINPLIAQKKPFTIEDLYRIKRISDPQISPDGNSIAFTVTEYDLKKGRSNSDIWVINADGSHLKQLTQSQKSDDNPRWSPDGKTLMFLSERGESSQIWLLPISGGEAKQLTDISTGISDPIWMPDGKSIVFASNIFPEYGAVDSLNARDLDAMKEGPIQAHMADKLLYRHWTSYDDGRKTHTLMIDTETKEVRDLTPGEYHAPCFSLGGRGYAVSPDAKEVCVVSNHDADPWSSTNADLWIVPLNGGDTKNITDDNEAFDGNPLYSPDSRYIAYLKQAIPMYEADRFRLTLYDRKTGQHHGLTESFDNWVRDFQWAPDSKSLYFTAPVQGHIPLFKVDIKSKKISSILDIKTIDAFDIAPNGQWIALIRRSVGKPTALHRVQANGKHLKHLEFINQKVEEEVDIRPAEEMWIDSQESRKVHVFIVKPHGFDPVKKYPLILNVHGGPQGMWADAFRGDWQVYPGSGYIVAFPNPTGSTGYGQEVTAAISKDWGGKVYEDVMAVADALEKLPYVDRDRMGAMGWSYGGYMMMWLEGHTTRFKAIASMMGVYDLRSMYSATEELWFPEWDLGGQPWNSELYEKWSPSNFVKNFKTPCLVITGEMDYRVPYTQSLQFFTDLQKMGVPSRLIVFPNDGHWPSSVKSMPLYYNVHLDWFHKYLGGEPAPYDMNKMVRNRHFEE